MVCVYEKKNIAIFGLRIRRFASLGDNVRFGGVSTFNHSGNISIGSDVFIGAEGYYDAISKLQISSGCMIGPRVVIIAGSHNYNSLDLKAIPFDDRQIDLPVYIGENVWIGANASIVPGTTIGEGSVVAMGATVSGHIPPCSVVVGDKARTVKSRDIETYDNLKANGQIYSRVLAGTPFQLIK